MTRLYNFFAQPPVQKEFCARAVPMIATAAALPAGAFESFATGALAQLDQPFVDFYRRYDLYRVELAAWKSGQQSPIPRLGVDPVVLLGQIKLTIEYFDTPASQGKPIGWVEPKVWADTLAFLHEYLGV